jgi:hypothetical protein
VARHQEVQVHVADDAAVRFKHAPKQFDEKASR